MVGSFKCGTDQRLEQFQHVHHMKAFWHKLRRQDAYLEDRLLLAQSLKDTEKSDNLFEFKK